MATKVDRLVIDRVEPRTARLRMIGTTPLYMNAMTDHAKKTLLIGGTRKTAADKARIKHDPLNEFRGSAYRYRGEETALGFPQTGIKAALCDAAMETGGVTKAKSTRLLFVHSGRVAVYGTPYLKMDVVRSSDINRTPDVRTRCYLPRWACEVEIGFMAPHLNVESVMTLFANAGQLIGIGDFRQQKGAGNYGSFRVADTETPDPEYDDLLREGRAVQEAALQDPECADDETMRLYDLVLDEQARRAA